MSSELGRQHSCSHVLISRKNIYVEASIKMISPPSTTAHNYLSARGQSWFDFLTTVSLYDLCVSIAAAWTPINQAAGAESLHSTELSAHMLITCQLTRRDVED